MLVREIAMILTKLGELVIEAIGKAIVRMIADFLFNMIKLGGKLILLLFRKVYNNMKELHKGFSPELQLV